MRRSEQQINHLTLACQAMWELLRDTSEVSEKDLEEKILEVDARDGSVNGKIGNQVLVCGACGRNTNSRRKHCIMCGAPIDRPHQFEA
ncbi:MAG: hypothetical protein AAF191_01415 [Verrucomicrobiota bacterium]